MKHMKSHKRHNDVSSSVRARIAEAHGIRRRVRELEWALELECRTLRQVIHATDDVTLILDKEGLILALNGQAAIALGTATDESLGRPLWELLLPPLRNGLATAVHLAMESGRSTTVFDQAFLPGTVHLRCEPVLDSSGKICRVVITAKDKGYAGGRQIAASDRDGP